MVPGSSGALRRWAHPPWRRKRFDEGGVGQAEVGGAVAASRIPGGGGADRGTSESDRVHLQGGAATELHCATFDAPRQSLAGCFCNTLPSTIRDKGWNMLIKCVSPDSATLQGEAMAHGSAQPSREKRGSLWHGLPCRRPVGTPALRAGPPTGQDGRTLTQTQLSV